MSDTTASQQPTSAGMNDSYLDGTANSAADRASAKKITHLIPETTHTARANWGSPQQAT